MDTLQSPPAGTARRRIEVFSYIVFQADYLIFHHIDTVQTRCLSRFSYDFHSRGRMVVFALTRSFKWFTNVKAMRLRATSEKSRGSTF